MDATPTPPPSSLKGLFGLLAICAAVAVVLYFLLGDAWMRWFKAD